jgi:hypothetical protein
MPFHDLAGCRTVLQHRHADQVSPDQIEVVAFNRTETQPDCEFDPNIVRPASNGESKSEISTRLFNHGRFPGNNRARSDRAINNETRRANLVTSSRIIAFELR